MMKSSSTYSRFAQDADMWALVGRNRGDRPNMSADSSMAKGTKNMKG